MVHRIKQVFAIFSDEHDANITPCVTTVAVTKSQDGLLACLTSNMAGVLGFACNLGVHGEADGLLESAYSINNLANG